MIQTIRTISLGLGLGVALVSPMFLVAQEATDLDLLRAGLVWVKSDQKLTNEKTIGVDGERTGRSDQPAAASQLNQLAAAVGGRVVATTELVRCKHPQVNVQASGACRLNGLDILVSVRVVRAGSSESEILVSWERNEGERVHAETALLRVHRTSDGWKVTEVLLRERS